MRREITRFARNSCVVAGAGAGKTTCLVDTFLGLLTGGEGREPLEPGQVVAITFTEKAAGEMKARLVAKVAEMARHSGREGARWRAMLSQVEWAPISTIHSFAAQILREFGVAAGLDPDFAVADQETFDLLLDEVLEALFREWLSRGEPRLGRVLSHYSLEGGLSQALKELFHSLATEGLTAEEARQASREAHEKELEQAPRALEELRQSMGDLAALAVSLEGSKSKTPEYVFKLRRLVDVWPGIWKVLLNNPLHLNSLERVDIFLKGNWGKAREEKDRAKEAVKALMDLALLPQALELTDDLLSLTGELESDVAKECARRALVSFDGLLTGALNLVENRPGVLAELRRRYRALMVDEFQDVNPVQGRLVARLAGVDGREGDEAAPPPLLMVVGDRKQSIYAFRGADVSLFNHTMTDFQNRPEADFFPLPENFRSRPILVGFFNRLFGQVFADQGLSQEFPKFYVDFLPTDLQTPGVEREEPSHPAVEVLDIRENGDLGNMEAWRRAEARVLADHLAGILGRGEARPGDIAILLRKMTNVAVYEEALTRAGLDFYTVRGRGYYACREVADISLALSALLDPENDPSLAGWLRSPLVGLSDETLLALTHPHPGDARRSLSRGFLSGEPLPDWVGEDDIRRLEGARRLTARLSPLARRLYPAELVSELCRQTLAEPLLLAGPGGDQKAANLRALLERARDASGTFAGGPENFIRALDRLTADPPDTEPQAALLGEDAEVIRLMSVHQAKGLQFGVVALPDLTGQPPVAFPLRGPDSRGVCAAAPRDPLSGQRQRSPVYLRLDRRDRASAEAEEARLFYVAVTRAVNRLVFCLHSGDRRDRYRWAGWVSEQVAGDEAAHTIRPDRAPAAVKRVAAAQQWPGFLPPDPGPRDGEGAELVRRALEPNRPRPRQVRVSVSGMENWFTCPRMFLLTDRLGLDTAALPPLPGGERIPAGAAELGTLVHALFERADLWAGPQSLDPVLAEMGQTGREEGRQALKAARRLWDTPLGDILAQAGPLGVLRERPFLMSVKGGSGTELLLRGELDLLVLGDPRGPLLVDYKVSAHRKPEKYRLQLALYALALKRGLGAEGPPPRAAILYLDPDGGGAELMETVFQPGELQELEKRLGRAAEEIAALGSLEDPSLLPAGPDCRREVCPLAALCPA